MQPRSRQVPPRFLSFSIMAVRSPSCPARTAATYPPGPEPMMITSNVSFALNAMNASLTGASRWLARHLLQRNADFVAFDLNVELLDFGDGVDRRDAACEAERPAVPGALNGAVVAIDVAFANRPAAMRADVIKREVFAVDVEQRYRAAPDFNYHALHRCEIGGLRHFDEFRHCASFQTVNLAAIVTFMS